MHISLFTVIIATAFNSFIGIMQKHIELDSLTDQEKGANLQELDELIKLFEHLHRGKVGEGTLISNSSLRSLNEKLNKIRASYEDSGSKQRSFFKNLILLAKMDKHKEGLYLDIPYNRDSFPIDSDAKDKIRGINSMAELYFPIIERMLKTVLYHQPDVADKTKGLSLELEEAKGVFLEACEMLKNKYKVLLNKYKKGDSTEYANIVSSEDFSSYYDIEQDPRSGEISKIVARSRFEMRALSFLHFLDKLWPLIGWILLPNKEARSQLPRNIKRSMVFSTLTSIVFLTIIRMLPPLETKTEDIPAKIEVSALKNIQVKEDLGMEIIENEVIEKEPEEISLAQ